MEKLVTIAKKHAGFITSGMVTEAGLPRRLLREAVDSGVLYRPARGLYALPEVWEDEYLVAQHRFRRGVFSHESALFLNGVSERTPSILTMTFPRGYNTSTVLSSGIVAKTVAPDLIGLGKIKYRTTFGNKVDAYDIERTLCDLVRGQAVPDVEVVNPAMKRYVLADDRDINKLMSYASKLGVESKIRNYMEVLL